MTTKTKSEVVHGEQDYYTEVQMAERLGITPARLKSRRFHGRNHPPYVRIGWVILYPKSEFWNWMAAQKLRRGTG